MSRGFIFSFMIKTTYYLNWTYRKEFLCLFLFYIYILEISWILFLKYGIIHWFNKGIKNKCRFNSNTLSSRWASIWNLSERLIQIRKFYLKFSWCAKALSYVEIYRYICFNLPSQISLKQNYDEQYYISKYLLKNTKIYTGTCIRNSIRNYMDVTKQISHWWYRYDTK